MKQRQLQLLVVAAAVVKLSQSIVPYITDGEFDIMIKTAKQILKDSSAYQKLLEK